MVRPLGAALAALLAACAPPAAPPVSAAAPAEPPAVPFDVGPIRSAAEYAGEAPFATADLARGELLGLACAACHRFGAGEGTLIGPNLHGVFGRKAASLPEFDYSPALEATGLVWTPVSLEAWLAAPATFVEGTTMAFAGYRSAEDRRDLIAFLLKITE
jgi:cytochrome c